jgi:uncharacterized protein YndB with AHSA1/START domain
MPAFSKITVSAVLAASPVQAWKAFTTPNSIIQWNFASDDWCCPKATIDLREGGSFNYRMESKDGKYGFNFYGIFTKIVPESRIEYSLGDERSVSIVFRESNGKTELTETFDAETENSLELQKNGWQAILENFRKYTESAGNLHSTLTKENPRHA